MEELLCSLLYIFRLLALEDVYRYDFYRDPNLLNEFMRRIDEIIKFGPGVENYIF